MPARSRQGSPPWTGRWPPSARPFMTSPTSRTGLSRRAWTGSSTPIATRPGRRTSPFPTGSRCGKSSTLSASAASYAAEVLTVRLDSGAAFRVFLKNFGLSARPKDGPRQRREREVRVYRELLAGAGLGTAGYYGSVLDEARGRLWLLLEYVDG